MKRPKYFIGGRGFATKLALLDAIRAIRDAYTVSRDDLCANGYGRRISCAFRLMPMRLAIAVKGYTAAMMRPVSLPGREERRVRVRLSTRIGKRRKLRIEARP